MPKLRSDDDSERHIENSDDGSERQIENSDGSEHQNWKAMMALNAKLKSDDGSECQNWEVMKMALNVNEDVMMALNVETEDATLNVDLKTDDGSERRNWKYDEDSSEH